MSQCIYPWNENIETIVGLSHHVLSDYIGGIASIYYKVNSLISNWLLTVIILLEYINLFTTCMNIMPGNYYYVDTIMFTNLYNDWNIATIYTSFCYTCAYWPRYWPRLQHGLPYIRYESIPYISLYIRSYFKISF